MKLLRFRNLPQLVVAVVLLHVPTLSRSAFASNSITIRLGTVAPRGTPWERQLKRTEKMLKREIAGLRIRSYFGGAKGDEKSIVRQVRDGRLEMGGITIAAIATAAPDLQLLELPYLFESSEEADFVLDRYARPIIREILEDNGFVLYQLSENGWQNFGSKNGFITSPGALKGRKMRSQESPVHIATWKSFGAAPVEMSVSEVLPALRTGLVEGFANTPLFTFATGWYQAIEYYTVSRHLYQPGVVVYSKKWFDSLDPGVQKKLRETDVIEGQAYARAGIRAIEEPLIENFKKAGIKLYELSREEKAAFVAVAEKLRAQEEKKASVQGKRLLSAIRKGKAAYVSNK